MPAAQPLLELRGVSKHFHGGGIFKQGRKVQAAKAVSLTLGAGECLGLVGESGSGKSTLGRIILGIERPETGEVLFQGVNLYGKDKAAVRAVRRDLQVVFQDCFSSVNPRLTAGESIAEPLKNFARLSQREERRTVGELLELVGLKAGDAAKYPHQFSGGQLQRVCIARAISLRPKLIVLDEAVSSLDVLVQTQILALLSDLREELTMSYVFISHDLAAVARLSDRLAVMSAGEIVERLEDMADIQCLTHPVSLALLAAVLPAQPVSCFEQHSTVDNFAAAASPVQ
ncbi:MAG TPA: dipeptide/oligopeptide/nickel ABC transporter ATP-binding protein [Methylomusa anaerophila]|uniref:Glutathione import ATP-binding protein GsiA n=1 Tax=Methylomusa anaerophila TaxID=1930071 RepID=A0A348AE79_9FIRM|nr:dipeptide/oligopeptide/nickel ABC transporter ATP-binding protein [Methylomusa anaerophila]BBB89377.1 glutathione import ATP-binding protein GsiA [Methylomusa anaerophila]HML90453.1 dipeptide/oligopeptide/nickel ABC transporter ATP-binding protein [Methylomusa anaerophila]